MTPKVMKSYGDYTSKTQFQFLPRVGTHLKQLQIGGIFEMKFADPQNSKQFEKRIHVPNPDFLIPSESFLFPEIE